MLSREQIEAAAERVLDDARNGRGESAWAGINHLLRQHGDQIDVAQALIAIAESGLIPREKCLELLYEIYLAHSHDASVLGPLGEATERARDIDLLNDPPPDHPLFSRVVNSISELLQSAESTEAETKLLRGLATAARMMARQHDDLTERCYRRLVELAPGDSSLHYNLGLFLKTRGRFREGMLANQAGERLLDKYPEANEWNLGICATGAGEGRIALEVWKRLSQKIEMGRFDLPDGRYPDCKVRLAERPLAERSAQVDDPGREETIWIERLSPCHGIIRSVLYGDLGIDYGDVILFDGAPITHHKYGEKQIPVFPHLATLVRNRYRLFEFAGTQEESGQISDVSRHLERDAVVYSHTENFVQLCAACWRNPETEHHHEEKIDKRVVRGKIAAPPDLGARDLLRQLDAAIAEGQACRIYVPSLCEAAGLPDRATLERRRFEMIAGG